MTLYDQLEHVGDNLLLQNYQDLPERKEIPSDFQLVLSVNKDEGKALEEYPKLEEKEFGNLPSEKVLIGNVSAIKGFSGQKYQAVPTVWLINDGYLYTFQLSMPESTNKDLFDQILSTFKFTDSNSNAQSAEPDAIECVKEGLKGNYFSGQECCSESVELTTNDLFSDKSECSPVTTNGSFICGKCGNGICGLGENICNCPEDCR